MKVTFASEADPKFKVSPQRRVYELMEDAEDKFQQLSIAAGTPKELQINVLWNTKDHKKALNPNEKLVEHFADGESFGVYGDVVPIEIHPDIPEEEKLPVLILTGFLGAGKTTLLNYLLQEQKEKKIAIIENEFGEVSIDDSLLTIDKLAKAEKVIVMDNGCMCCTTRGDLAEGLHQMLHAIDGGQHIDTIVIETTGMADPAPIVKTFMADVELTDRIRLDGVVTVVDSRNLIGRLDDKVEEGKVNEAFQQVALADKILLNKLDLVTTDEAIAVTERIRDINQFAKVIPSIHGRVKVSELCDLRAHDIRNFVNDPDFDKEAEDVPELQPAQGHGHESGHDQGHGSAHGEGHGQDAGHGHGHGHSADSGSHGHGGHQVAEEEHGAGGHGRAHAHGHNAKNRHDSRVNSMSLVKTDSLIVASKLSKWIKSLGMLPAGKGTIFRIKAILAVKGYPNKHVFHAVMDVSDEDDAGPWGPDEPKVSKIVFIGKGLDFQFLKQGFYSIFEDAKPPQVAAQ